MSNVDVNFWKNKKVFLTGHTGFKGSWLSIWLNYMGAEVCGISLEPPTNPNNFTESRISNFMQSVIGDTRNSNLIYDTMKNFQPDIVIHLAAQPLVRLSYIEPMETYTTNIIGTLNVLESVKKIESVKAIVNVTTDKCYENKEWPWGYREDEPMGGHDPYSSSKGCSELITSCYQRSFFNKGSTTLASARAGNVIGGGDWAVDRIVPDTLRAFEKNKQVSIRYPKAIRPWQHVLEPLSGYLTLAQKLYAGNGDYSEGWNFGPYDMDAKPVEWIVDYMTKKWGGNVGYIVNCDNHPHEAHYLKLDISKAKSKLDWHPKWNLNTALDMTIEWHKYWLAGDDVHKVCVSQIESYLKN